MPVNRFRNTVENVMNKPGSYSKDDLRYLFLEMTEKYLYELISTLNYEEAIIASLGVEEGNKIIEKAATSDPALNEIGLINAEGNDNTILKTNIKDEKKVMKKLYQKISNRNIAAS